MSSGERENKGKATNKQQNSFFANRSIFSRIMFKHQPRRSDQFFVETKVGIVTQNRDWFHTTSDHIEQYVPGLLDAVSLETLIRDAEAWVRSADSLSLTLLLVLLFLINPWLAALTTLAFHWFWYNYKSGFVTRPLGKVLSFINSDGFLMIVAFVALSLLGVGGEYTAAVIGIVFFFIMKLGLLKMGWNSLAKDYAGSMTLNDRVLKMVIIKHAMHEDVAPAEVQTMEEQFKEVALNLKNERR